MHTRGWTGYKSSFNVQRPAHKKFEIKQLFSNVVSNTGILYTVSVLLILSCISPNNSNYSVVKTVRNINLVHYCTATWEWNAEGISWWIALLSTLEEREILNPLKTVGRISIGKMVILEFDHMLPTPLWNALKCSFSGMKQSTTVLRGKRSVK